MLLDTYFILYVMKLVFTHKEIRQMRSLISQKHYVELTLIGDSKSVVATCV